MKNYYKVVAEFCSGSTEAFYTFAESHEQAENLVKNALEGREIVDVVAWAEWDDLDGLEELDELDKE